MLNALFYQKIPFLTQISKRSTPTDLHHPDLQLAQFFSLESHKVSSAYTKTSWGLKMGKFFQTIICCSMIQTTFLPFNVYFFFHIAGTTTYCCHQFKFNRSLHISTGISTTLPSCHSFITSRSKHVWHYQGNLSHVSNIQFWFFFF